MENYDIVIVGAGPGGSSCAKTAAENGLNVLLIEKRKEIGAPKRCGEGLSLAAFKRINLKPEGDWLKQSIKGAFVFSPSGKRVAAYYPDEAGYVIERKIFDKWLAEQASYAGAKVLAGTRATALIKEDGKIKGLKIKNNDGEAEVKAKIVVAADGVESLVARWAGIRTNHTVADTCSGAQFEMSDIDIEDPHMLELYMGNEIAPGGYIWVFPKGDKLANVGIGTRYNYAKGKTAYQYLKEFVDSHPNLKKGSILEVNTGCIPVGGPLKELSADNLLIVGDAAHQVNAIHGGGIGEAIKAGQIAGEVAAKCIKSRDCSASALKEYDIKWYEERGNRLTKLVKLRAVVEQLKDKELDYLADQLSGEDIIGLAGAKGYAKFAKILAKKPSLLRFVPKLISSK
jgi:digeranylgeranylglycerophospholipid reductase